MVSRISHLSTVIYLTTLNGLLFILSESLAQGFNKAIVFLEIKPDRHCVELCVKTAASRHVREERLSPPPTPAHVFVVP